MRTKLTIALLGSALLFAPNIVQVDAAATPFSDDACPQANPSGRQLNELNASGHASSDDMLAAAKGLRDAYRDCATQFDRDVNMKNNNHQSDYIPVHRSYARLELARSLQRLGSFATQLHDASEARANYNAALSALDEMDGVLASAGETNAATENHLLSESHALRAEIKANIGQLLPAETASAAPTPSPSTK